MIGLIIFLLFLAAAGVTLLTTRDKMFETKIHPGNSYDRERTEKIFQISWLIKPIIMVVLGLLIASFQPYTLERVDSGSVGIKVNLTGDQRGVSKYSYETGWVVYNTWVSKFYEFPTFQQHIEYPNQIVVTKGGFEAPIKPTFNYSIKPEAVGDMFVNLRLDIKTIEQGWLMTAICGSVNDVANKWKVDDIFNNRQEFEGAIVTECNKRLSKWFIVSQLRTNIIPPDALKESIIAKTKGIQDAQAKEQDALTAVSAGKVKIANARADSAYRVITATGVANAAVIAAEGEARAMKAKQRELSPIYIDYIRASAWDGAYPTTVLGGGATTLYNLK